MKAFRFRLDRLLKLRERSEQERARALGEAMRAEEERRLAVDAAKSRLERIGNQLEGTSTGIHTAGTLRLWRMTAAAAAEHVEHVESSHRDASGEVEKEQERFREARKDRRVVERLRERRAAAWLTDASREEQKDIDDVSLRRRHGGEEK